MKALLITVISSLVMVGVSAVLLRRSIDRNGCDYCEDVKVYWKDSVLEFLKMDKAYRHNVSPFSWRFDMSCHVDADYDMFH